MDPIYQNILSGLISLLAGAGLTLWGTIWAHRRNHRWECFIETLSQTADILDSEGLHLERLYQDMTENYNSLVRRLKPPVREIKLIEIDTLRNQAKVFQSRLIESKLKNRLFRLHAFAPRDCLASVHTVYSTVRHYERLAIAMENYADMSERFLSDGTPLIESGWLPELFEKVDRAKPLPDLSKGLMILINPNLYHLEQKGREKLGEES